MVSQLASLFGAKKAPKRRRVAKKAKEEPPKGLYMVGSNGSGKTSILNVFYRSFPEEFPVVRLHWFEFCRDALVYMEGAAKKKGQGQNTYAIIADEIAAHCKVLLLDEVNITTISEGVLVKELFRQLWQRGITIVVNSPHKIDDLYQGGHNRGSIEDFFPEFHEHCPETNMSSDVDYRTVGVSGSGNFLVGLDDEKIAENNKKFESATHGYEKDVELAIPNQKRTIYTPAADRETGVARYNFEDLCGKPIGRTEYAIIARSFHTVFLDNIPKLEGSRGGDAIKVRRFVSLIDMLYDKKVNLHMLSAMPCQDIFTPTEDISADDREGWRRTQSTLTEMESTKYASMAWLMRRHLTMDKASHL